MALNPLRAVDQSRYSDKMPSYPAATLILHCGMKGLQVGSVVGLVAIAPVLAIRKRLPLTLAWNVGMTLPPLFGAGLVVAMLFGKSMISNDMGIEGIDDRAYRINHNKGQVRVDRYSYGGLAVGGALALLTKARRRNFIPGAFTGVAASLLLYVILN